MKKNKLLLIIIICLFANTGFAQYTFTSYRNKYFKKFLLTKTLVPITGIDSIDAKIKKTLKEKWTFTKLKFVPLNKLEQYKNESNVSIINLFHYTINNFGGNTSLSLYIPGDINDTRMANIIASSPIACSDSSYYGEFRIECGYEQIGYKIDILITQLIEVINFVKNEKYRPITVHAINRYVRKYNKKIIKSNKNIKVKPLLINETFFNKKLDSIKFKQFYTNKFRIVSEKVYKEILNSDNENYCVMLQSYNPRFTYSIFDLETKKTLFIGLNNSILFDLSDRYCFNLNQVIKLDRHVYKINKSIK